MSAEPVLSRRAAGAGFAALAAATALLTSGCDPEGGLDLPGLPETPDNPDEKQVAAGLRAEQQMFQRIALVRRRHRRLRDALAPTLAVHRAHVELLGGALDGAASDTDGGVDAGTRGSNPVPADPARAMADLVRLERLLADRHVATSVACRSGALARVVAVMSAAAAQQAVALAPLAVTPKGEDG